MNRLMIIAALLTPLLAAGYAVPAKAADVGFSLRIGDRYHGDALRFRDRPRFVAIPDTRVYYIDDPDRDVYRYGGFYYAFDSGRWFRASRYSGPWIYVRGRQVPRAIYMVPADYRHNWRGDYRYWRNRDYDRDWDRNRNSDMDRRDRYRDRYRDRDRGY
jgi:hypothetical protein